MAGALYRTYSRCLLHCLTLSAVKKGEKKDIGSLKGCEIGLNKALPCLFRTFTVLLYAMKCLLHTLHIVLILMA